MSQQQNDWRLTGALINRSNGARQRLLASFFCALATSVLLAGCGPEAPPCNDPESTQSVLSMVSQAHDDHLKGLPYASKDLATFELDAVAPTAYDDKLKMRSCKAVFVMTLQKDKAEAADRFVKVMSSSLLNLSQSFQGLAALAGGSASATIAEMQRDALQLQILNPGPVRADPIRKSITYQIQKQEGGKDFMISTNVDVTQTIPYLRVASRAQKMMEEATAKNAQRDAEKVKKDAEIERLSATGTWRKVVYIKDFGEESHPGGRCSERGLYCFQGFDGKDQFDTSYYQLDAKKVDARGREAMDVAYRGRQPVCLIGVRKSAVAGVFAAEGYSTFRDDKGEAVDCLPGAEKQSWAETLGKGGSPAAPPVAAAPQASATPATPQSGPENLESLITRYERCGEEAVCLHTAKGNTIYMQASQMRHADFAMLDAAIKGRSTVCLKEVIHTEGKSFTAESLDSRC